MERMNHRGKLIVIPNEDEILQEIFERNVRQGESHTRYLQEFSDTYMLGLHFEEDDYQKAPCDIAELGHMVIKVEDDASLVIFYLPERITDRQYLYIYSHQTELEKYTEVSGFSLRKEENSAWENIHKVSGIIEEATRKNLLQVSKSEGTNVR